MSFTDKNGNVVTKEQVKLAVDLLKESIKNQLDSWENEKYADSALKEMFKMTYENRLEEIEKDFEEMDKSEDYDYEIESALEEELKDLNKFVFDNMDADLSKVELPPQEKAFYSERLINMNDPSVKKAFGSKSIREKSNSGSEPENSKLDYFKNDLKELEFVKKPMKELKDMGDFSLEKEEVNPNYRKVDELTSAKAMELSGKENITATDIYNTFLETNSFIRKYDVAKTGKRFNGSDVNNPAIMYETMNFIADNMNRINKIEDSALRKSQGLQLAAFAYSVANDSRFFKDGNSRTGSLMADTILKSYGLPAHVPQENELQSDYHLTGYDMLKDELVKGVKEVDMKVKAEAEAEARVMEIAEVKPGMKIKLKNINNIYKQLTSKKIDPFYHKNTPEYNEMLKAVKTTLDYVKKRGMVGADVETMNALFTQIENAAVAYIDEKNYCPSTDRGEARLQLAANLLANVNEGKAVKKINAINARRRAAYEKDKEIPQIKLLSKNAIVDLKKIKEPSSYDRTVSALEEKIKDSEDILKGTMEARNGYNEMAKYVSRRVVLETIKGMKKADYDKLVEKNPNMIISAADDKKVVEEIEDSPSLGAIVEKYAGGERNMEKLYNLYISEQAKLLTEEKQQAEQASNPVEVKEEEKIEKKMDDLINGM